MGVIRSWDSMGMLSILRFTWAMFTQSKERLSWLFGQVIAFQKWYMSLTHWLRSYLRFNRTNKKLIDAWSTVSQPLQFEQSLLKFGPGILHVYVIWWSTMLYQPVKETDLWSTFSWYTVVSDSTVSVCVEDYGKRVWSKIQWWLSQSKPRWHGRLPNIAPRRGACPCHT